MEHFTDSEVAQLYGQLENSQNKDRFSEFDARIKALEHQVVNMMGSATTFGLCPRCGRAVGTYEMHLCPERVAKCQP